MAKRRIRRPKEQEELYKKLTSSDSPLGAFDSYKDLFMLAGVIGYKIQKKRSFKDSAEGIAWSVFNLDTDFTVITSIAILDSKDLTLLRDTDETHDKKLTIFEEYAAEGVSYIYNLLNSSRNASDVLYEYVYESRNEMDEREQNLQKIMEGLGGGLSW
jgi:dnd system-associated protein 4